MEYCQQHCCCFSSISVWNQADGWFQTLIGWPSFLPARCPTWRSVQPSVNLGWIRTNIPADLERCGSVWRQMWGWTFGWQKTRQREECVRSTGLSPAGDKSRLDVIIMKWQMSACVLARLMALFTAKPNKHTDPCCCPSSSDMEAWKTHTQTDKKTGRNGRKALLLRFKWI